MGRGKRIIIVGTSGSGKTTLAQELSRQLHIPHIELDNFYWGKNWSINHTFESELQSKLKSDEWIICGNYSPVREVIWSTGNILIWLDYPFLIVFWRALIRSFKRIYNKEQVCGENRESITRLFSKNSILLWVIQTYFKRKKEYSFLLSLKKYAHLEIIRIRTPKQLSNNLSFLFSDCEERKHEE